MKALKTQLNDYKFLKKLGSGGSGEVYKALHLPSNKTVAIKILNETGNPERYKNEANLQASVSHKNIASLYDFIYENETFYLIMEYVSGISLTEFIQRSQDISISKKKRIFKNIVKAVAYLHNKNIIHRDLKPSNIKITPEGSIKLIDFGISKGLATPKITRDGFLVGTIEYVAPERVVGESKLQSDIWSLGIIYYELLTGNKFEIAGKTDEHLKKIKSKQFSQNLLEGLAKEDAAIIKKCLSNNYRKRYASADELLNAIDHKNNKISGSTRNLPTVNLNYKWSVGMLVIFIAAYFVLKPNPTKLDIIKDQAQVTLILHPPHAVLNCNGKLYHTGDKIMGKKGETFDCYLTAKKYNDKDVIIAMPTNRNSITLEYTLQN